MNQDEIYVLDKRDLSERTFTNDDSFANGGVSVRVSPDEGNALEIRATGLYVGEISKADNLNLFVANDGNDSNTGTRANPLRTVREAFIRNKEFTSFNIYLKEGETHEWRSSWGDKLAKHKRFTVRTYGETTDVLSLSNNPNTVDYLKSAGINRATIKLISDKVLRDNSVKSTLVNSDAFFLTPMCKFIGVTLDLTSNLPENAIERPNQMFSFGNPNYGLAMEFIGCQFMTSNKVMMIHIGGISEIRLDSCQIDTTIGNKFIHLSSGAMLSLSILGSGQNGSEMYNEHLRKRATPSKESWQALITGDFPEFSQRIFVG